MSKIIIFIGFVCVLQLASCRVVREAPADTTDTLKDLSTKVGTAVGTLNEGFLKVVNVSSNAELTDLVRTQTEEYADKVKTLVSQFTDEVKANSGPLETFFKSITESITSTADKFKESNPEVASVQETFEKGLKNILEESDKLKTKLMEDGKDIPKTAEKFLKDIYEGTFEAAKAVSEKLDTATKKD